MDKSDYLSGKASENRRTNNVWGMFFGFIRRASKFMKYMKNRSINHQFEHMCDSCKVYFTKEEKPKED